MTPKDDMSPWLKKLIADGAVVEIPQKPGERRVFVPVSQQKIRDSIREHQKNQRRS